MELISIGEIAKELGWPYHRTRNRLARNEKTKGLAHKVGHAVCYEKKALEILREASRLPL